MLDEADRMLEMGFIPDVRRIIYDSYMPCNEERRTLMFSATYPTTIQKLAEEFLHQHILVTIGKVNIACGYVVDNTHF